MTKSTKDRNISRREALVGLGTVGGASLLGACERGWAPPEQDAFGRARNKPPVPGADGWATHEERWTKSSCGQCAVACGIRVRVVEGRAIRIEGNSDNPVNRGGIGPRGLAGLQALYDPDRLTGPMIRKDGRLVPSSWDDALAMVSGALGELRQKGEGHRLLIMSGRERGMMNELLARFAAAFGTPNFVDGRPSRSAVLAQAMDEAFDSFELPVFDWSGANYVLSLEAGLFEGACQIVYAARLAAELRHNKSGVRPKIVHTGWGLDLAALGADEWLRVAPGSSGALALGLCRELLASELYDPAVVAQQGDALESFRAFVESFTPERVAELTGIEPATTRRLAVELWKHRPSFAFIDERSLAYSNGRETALATFALNALLGAVEASVGGMRLAPEVPLRAWPELVLDDQSKAGVARPRMDKAGSAEFPRARAVLETLVEAIDASPPAVGLLYFANPAYARHQPGRWREALAKVPLLVSFSPYLDETVAELAHVVLPDHTYLERFEDALPAPSIPRAVIGVHKPVVAPLHDTRSTGDVVLDLARRLGGAVASALPWETFQGAVEARLLGLYDVGRGSVRTSTERGFLEALYEAALWADTAAPPARAAPPRLVASWKEPSWAGSPDEYPLRLLLYRGPGHAEGSGANQPWLHTLRTRPSSREWEHAALLHPSSAAGFADGEIARVASEWGQVAVPLRFDPRMVPGYISLSLGGGHRAFGRFAKGIGVNGLELVAPGAAPTTGASVLCGTRVRLQREGGRG